MPPVVTLDFQVTSRCKQACAACTALACSAAEADSQAAAAIVRKARALGIPRVIFTGGDPMLRPDIGMLLRLARQERLESVLVTPGDAFTDGFLRAYGRWIDQIAFPLDGPNEAITSRRKRAGHFQKIMGHLERLKAYPEIDVKLDVAVTRLNLNEVRELLAFLDRLAPTLPNRLSVDVVQVRPAGPSDPGAADLLVSDEDFAALRAGIEGEQRAYPIRWFDRHAADGIRLTVLPDGQLVAHADGQLHDLGPMTAIRTLEPSLEGFGFDPDRHLQHALTWSSRRREAAGPE